MAASGKKTITRALILWWAASLPIAPVSAYAEVPQYTLAADGQSTLSFVATQNNAPLKGRFTQFSADIAFESRSLQTSHIEVQVNIGSIAMEDMEVANTLKEPEWFSAAAFPQAEFKSSHITAESDKGDYAAEGVLTIKQHAAPVVLHFHMDHQDSLSAEAHGYVTLKRGDFAVGEGQWASYDSIKNDVRVEFRIVAKKK